MEFLLCAQLKEDSKKITQEIRNIDRQFFGTLIRLTMLSTGRIIRVLLRPGV